MVQIRKTVVPLDEEEVMALEQIIVDSDENYNLSPYIKDFGDLTPPNETDENVWPGVIYDDSRYHSYSKALLRPSSIFFPLDQWGSAISGCAPVFFADGRLSGIVCFDIKTNDKHV